MVRLPPAQQIDLFARLGEYLDERPAKSTPVYANARAQARALADLRRVCAELGRDPKTGITAREYDALAKRDGLMRAGAVLRAYNGWENAEAVLMGETIPRTPQQNAKQRNARRGHSRSERLAMVRKFLASNPSETTLRAYDEWAVDENAKRESGDPWLLTSGSIRFQSGGLRWSEVLATDRGEEVPALAESEYPFLITKSMVASLTHSSRDITCRQDFPVPVATSSNCRLWLRDDILAYCAGKPVPARKSFSMQTDVLFTQDLAARLGVGTNRVARLVHTQEWLRGKIPEPCATAKDAAIVWWRSDVDRFFAERDANANDNSG